MSEALVFAPRIDRPTLPNPWMRLPMAVASLVANPVEWGVVQPTLPAGDAWESIAAAAGTGGLRFAEPVVIDRLPSLPDLAPKELRLPAWKDAAVEACHASLGKPVRSKVDLTALQAGILQMGDHLTPSHEHSQSIEGRGARQAGDYWHAINHRREPDDGNAKYWFRQVGNHPVLAELALLLPELADEFSAGVREKGLALVAGGRVDSFRFVDLASEARRRSDPELTAFVERLQWIEMIHLLESTLKDTVG